MPDPLHPKGFPDVTNKLAAPSKKSLFERQRAEAEAKRKKEEAETAAVLRDFEKSFDQDEDDRRQYGGGRESGFGGSVPPTGPRGGMGGTPRRHFVPSGGSMMKLSGPGSLGPPPSSLSRKRAYDGSFARSGVRDKDNSKGMLMFDEQEPRHQEFKSIAAFDASDEDDDEGAAEDRAAPKPTLHLSKLPPGTSAAVIKALMPESLIVDSVRFLPQSANTSERQHFTAIVTLSKDTPSSEIDTAVNLLQNKYLGLGYNLAITRHLSSSLLSSGAPSMLSSSISQPFGAKAIIPANVSFKQNRGPPPSIHRGAFAPPQAYGVTPGRQPDGAQVIVNPPTDITTLKLIHKTAEAVMLHGPAFEALLMSRVSIQRDERWSWLWDARSPAGVWYRWRLWEMLSGSATSAVSRVAAAEPPHIFDIGAAWVPPDRDLSFEFTTEFEEFISDRDYDSSEEEESGDEGQNQPIGVEQGQTAEYLNPLKKAKLVHLMSRLPSNTVRLRKGDVARVTAFAITHAGKGSEEVVQMLIDNVEHPFIYSGANYEELPRDHDRDHSAMEEDSAEEKMDKDKDGLDKTSAKLIGLYLISDLLSSSSTSGVRHAWRYRQQFEAALQSRGTFVKLGQVEREMNWGRIKAEKWRRAITQVLTLWEGWCVFSSTAQEALQKDFIDTAEDKASKEEAEKERKREEAAKKKSAWKAVDTHTKDDDQEMAEEREDVDGEPLEDEDLDGEPMIEDDDDFDGEPMDEDEDLDGAQMEKNDSDNDQTKSTPGDVEAEISETLNNKTVDVTELGKNMRAAEAKKKRATAVDLFGDSD